MFNWRSVFNLFEKYSEKQLLTVGILFFIIGCAIGYFYNLTFDGAIDIHYLKGKQTLKNAFLENAIIIFIATSVLFILGKAFNRKTRLIDILNVALIYRIPIYLASLFILFPFLQKASEKIVNDLAENKLKIDSPEILLISLAGIILVVFIVFAIYLLVKGFKIATNIKKWQHTVVLIITLIIIEYLTLFTIHNFLN